MWENSNCLTTNVTTNTSYYRHHHRMQTRTQHRQRNNTRKEQHTGRAAQTQLTSDVDVAGAGPHGEPGEEAALHQLVRVLAHDLPVLARAW